MLWRADQHEPLTARPWDAAVASDAIGAIVADAEAAVNDAVWPGHPLDDVVGDEPLSLYLGSAGVIWALSRLGSAFNSSAAVATALDRYRATPDYGADRHPPSLLMGGTGLLVVADKLGSPAADRRRLSELVRANREHPTWELMWGSPGTILAACTCGLDGDWRDSAELLYAQWDRSADMWTHNLYGRFNRTSVPSMALRETSTRSADSSTRTSSRRARRDC
jgi:hypothetical protein